MGAVDWEGMVKKDELSTTSSSLEHYGKSYLILMRELVVFMLLNVVCTFAKYLFLEKRN